MSNKPVAIAKLSYAISALGKANFPITADMSVMDLLSEFVKHEQEKAREKAEANMFVNDEFQE